MNCFSRVALNVSLALALVLTGAASAEEDEGILPVLLPVMKTGTDAQKVAALKAVESHDKLTPLAIELLALGLASSETDEVKLATCKVIEAVLFAEHKLVPPLAKALIPNLKSDNLEVVKASAKALYNSGFGYEFSPEETEIFREALKSDNADLLITLTWTVEAMKPAVLNQLAPELVALLTHTDARVRERVIHNLTSIPGNVPVFTKAAIEQLKVETESEVITELLMLALKGGMTSEVQALLLQQLKNPESSVRLVVAALFGELGNEARPAIPELLLRCQAGGVDRLSATRALLYLRPIVDRQKGYDAMVAVKKTVQGKLKLIYSVAIIAFSDANDPDQRQVLESEVKEIEAALIEEAQTGLSAEVNTVVELLPFCGENARAITPSLLAAYPQFKPVRTEAGIYLRPFSNFVRAILASHPGSDLKNSVVVKYFGDEDYDNDENLFVAHDIHHLLEQFPFAPKAEIAANINALVLRAEDKTEQDELRAEFARAAWNFGKDPAVKARLKALLPEAGRELKEMIEAALAVSNAP